MRKRLLVNPSLESTPEKILVALATGEPVVLNLGDVGTDRTIRKVPVRVRSIRETPNQGSPGLIVKISMRAVELPLGINRGEYELTFDWWGRPKTPSFANVPEGFLDQNRFRIAEPIAEPEED